MNKNIRYAFLMGATLFAASANSAPMAYSVNSDSLTGDSLYLIDLATGVDQVRGKLDTGLEFLTDTEGLAFAPDPDGNHPNGNLWGIDDPLEILFPISAANGSVDYREEIQLPPLPAGPDEELIGGNDFGMTFTCENTIFFTSVRSQSLFHGEPNGDFTTVGSVGALGVNISAIAAIGNPTKLYGIGNGLFENGETDSPNLYSINTSTGVASIIGPLSVTNEFKYNEAGLAFDSEGGLWAITDRSQVNGQKSQILNIDVATGAASLVAETLNEIGYESLAIAPPANCDRRTEFSEDFVPIPSLNVVGRIAAVLVLMLAGMLFLRRGFN